MKVLKVILQYKILIFLFLVIPLSIIRINFNNVPLVNEKKQVELVLKIKNIKYKNDKYTIEFGNLISYYNDNFPYDVGDTVKVKGNYKNISKNTIPNLFNYKEYLQSKNIQYEFVISEIKLIKPNSNLLNTIRNKIVCNINKQDRKEYLYAFVLGDTSYLNSEIREAFEFNGLSYLLSLGSIQVMILSKLIEGICKKIRCKRKYIFIIVSGILSFYLFLTNYTIGVLRSSLCYLINNLFKLLKIKKKKWEVILLVMCFLLIINPFYLYRNGFYYSFIVSFGISLFRIGREKKLWKKNVLFSACAFFLCLPITIYTNFEINFLAIALSIIMVPFISFMVFPLSLLVIIIPNLSFLWNIVINILESINIFFCNISLFNFIFQKPHIIIVLVYYLILILCFIKRKYIILLVIIMLIHVNFNKIIQNNFVLFLDVHQGDATILKTHDTVYMIDTGGSYNYQYSKDIIKCLKSYGLSKIDILIITHGDYDHMGEAINLVENFKVEKVIFNCGSYNDLESELIKVLDKKHIKYYSCIKELNIDNNKLYFLQTKEYDNENDNSNVIYAELNGYKFMFMGDASSITEKEIMNKYNLPNIDVLKVGHHGSRTSSSIEFINEINPGYSIISVGKNNRYGHPNKEVLDNLKDSKIYRTDQDGSIMFKIKNNKLQIETCSP